MVDIVRKYIRYALNEKPFNPELVASLIQFRKASMLDDSQVAEILNDISRRIVREKGISLWHLNHPENSLGRTSNYDPRSPLDFICKDPQVYSVVVSMRHD